MHETKKVHAFVQHTKINYEYHQIINYQNRLNNIQFHIQFSL